MAETFTEWRQRAACRHSGLHPDTWFPNPGDSAARETALKVCRRCPVIRDCAMYALRTQPPHGVWAGMTQKQLSALIGVPASQRIKTTPRLQPCGTLAAYTRHYRNGEKPCAACRDANHRATSDKWARR
jgi:WhiB family redox-sensing transcriptional regulator